MSQVKLLKINSGVITQLSDLDSFRVNSIGLGVNANYEDGYLFSIVNSQSTPATLADGVVVFSSAGDFKVKQSDGSIVGGFAAGGDLSGTDLSQTVLKINGTSVPATPSTNQVLVATSGTTSVWSQIVDGYVAANAAIAGTKVSPSFGTQNISTSGSLNVGQATAASLSTSLLSLAGKEVFTAITVPALSNEDEGVIYFDSTDKVFKVSEDSGAYRRLVSALDTTIGGGSDGYIVTWNNTANEFQLQPSGTLGAYDCISTVNVGDVVYLSASNTVDKADADDALKQPLIGVVQSKPSSTTALVKYTGELSAFSSLSPGNTYYLSTDPGGVTTTAPVSVGSIVQRIGFAKNATTLVVMIDRDFVENN